MFLLIYLPFNSIAQTLFYDDTFKGGVVTGGYSTGITTGGSGSWTVSIPAGSTIRRAYLFGGRLGPVASQNVTLNGTPFQFNGTNQVSPSFNSIYGGASGVHAIDVTASISAATTNYTLNVAAQNSVSNKYPEFYLFIAFNNAALPQISTVIYLQNADPVATMNWACNVTSPISTSTPVGFTVLGGYMQSGSASDCETIIVNGTTIGNMSGQDFNAASAYGGMGAYQYYNGTLTGYGDDNASQAVNGPECLSDIRALISNNATNVPITFQHCPAGSGGDNNIWLSMLSYGTAVVLPAEIMTLGVRKVPTGAEVYWETHRENNSSYFTVEKSLTGNDFTEMGKVQAIGTSQSRNPYQFIDSKPSMGINYYRIKTTNYDGTTETSDAKTLYISENGFDVKITGANPVADRIHFSPSFETENNELEVFIYSSTGQLIESHRFNQLASVSSNLSIACNHYSAGIYFAHFVSGISRKSHKIIVKDK